MAASYVLQALDAGFVSLVFTNASRAMPPWGGPRRPFSARARSPQASRAEARAFRLDMSPAVAARGKIRIAEKRGEKIPLGYALDGDGRPTTDPTEALKGVVLPIGGPKGSGLSMLMDIFGGVLSGAALPARRRSIQGVRPAAERGTLLPLAMSRTCSCRRKNTRARMDTLVERVRPAQGRGLRRDPDAGRAEAREEEKRPQKGGIPYSAAEIDPLSG